MCRSRLKTGYKGESYLDTTLMPTFITHNWSLNWNINSEAGLYIVQQWCTKAVYIRVYAIGVRELVHTPLVLVYLSVLCENYMREFVHISLVCKHCLCNPSVQWSLVHQFVCESRLYTFRQIVYGKPRITYSRLSLDHFLVAINRCLYEIALWLFQIVFRRVWLWLIIDSAFFWTITVSELK